MILADVAPDPPPRRDPRTGRQLEDKGVLLAEPVTRQLDGKLRETRFHLGSRRVRITYWIASGRRIILLTVFPKTKARERHEITRAKLAMAKCIAEKHTVEDVR